MERIVTAAELRDSLSGLLDKVRRGEQIVITHRGQRRAVLLSYDRLQTLQEIARLARDPQALAAMQRSDDDVRRGRVYTLPGHPSVRRILAVSGRRRTTPRA